MQKFKLWDKKKKVLLGPFTLNDVKAVSIDYGDKRPAIVKDNKVIMLKDIESRYLQTSENATALDFK